MKEEVIEKAIKLKEESEDAQLRRKQSSLEFVENPSYLSCLE